MKRTVPWLITAALPLLLARAALPGLADPSEARYGQICREMAEGGDWLVPTWQGIPHLEKPPLAYWAGAAGMSLLGRTELGARLAAVFALALSALWVAGIARRVAGPESAAPAALGMLLSPLTVAAGAACLTDPFLLATTCLFYHSVLRRLHDGNPRALDVAALALALGFLAKGHMILLFTVVPLALARTGVFRELWRPRRLLILLALAAPWFALIEGRFPGFLRYQLQAVGGRAGGSGHRAPALVYVFALTAGLFPFFIYAPRGFARLFPLDRQAGVLGLLWRLVAGGEPGRRLLALWLLVPLIVLSAAQSRLWTYILPVAPPVLVFAAARLGEDPRSGSRRAVYLLAGAGLAAILWWWLGRPASWGTVLPFLLPVGAALLLAGGWLLLARRLPRTGSTAGLAAILVACFVEGACFHEDLFDVHRTFAREVSDLSAETGSRVVVAGMSLPSIGFYCDRPVLIAGETGRLAIEAETWGKSPLFAPDTDVLRLLKEDLESVIVVKEKTLLAEAPERIPILRADGIAAVWGPAKGSGPVRPVR